MRYTRKTFYIFFHNNVLTNYIITSFIIVLPLLKETFLHKECKIEGITLCNPQMIWHTTSRDLAFKYLFALQSHLYLPLIVSLCNSYKHTALPSLSSSYSSLCNSYKHTASETQCTTSQVSLHSITEFFMQQQEFDIIQS